VRSLRSRQLHSASWCSSPASRPTANPCVEPIGAERVDPETSDPYLRRLIAAAQQLAAVTEIPPPLLYVTEKDVGINALAAGHTFEHTVLVVSRGALRRLERDELRALVAHQLSRIAHGDAKLNLTLAVLLGGLTSVADLGRYLSGIEWIDDADPRAGVGSSYMILSMLFGAILRVIGSIGVLSARIVQSTYSRSRMYRADLDAADRTSPGAIATTLRKVMGLGKEGNVSVPSHWSMDALTHLYFCEPRRDGDYRLLPAHPRLRKRIRRLRASAAEPLPSSELVFPADELATLKLPDRTFRAAPDDIDELPGAVTRVTPLPQLVPSVSPLQWDYRVWCQAVLLPPLLEHAIQVPGEASQLALALLSSAGASDPVASTAFGRSVQMIPPEDRVRVLERIIPTLRAISDTAAEVLARAHAMVIADSHVSLSELTLYAVLQSGLRPEATTRQVQILHELRTETALVLSLLAYLRDPTNPERPFAAAAMGKVYAYVHADQIELRSVADSLERLGRLAPGARRGLIRAATAVVFFEGASTTEAVTFLRALCVVVRSELPEQLQAEPC